MVVCKKKKMSCAHVNVDGERKGEEGDFCPLLHSKQGMR